MEVNTTWLITFELANQRAWKVLFTCVVYTKEDYYMAVFHKDWELLNSLIWLAEMDIDRSLDFPI